MYFLGLCSGLAGTPGIYQDGMDGTKWLAVAITTTSKMVPTNYFEFLLVIFHIIHRVMIEMRLLINRLFFTFLRLKN